LQRSGKSVPKDKLNIVLKRTLKDEAEKIGVHFRSSYFVHGIYDSLTLVTANDIGHVKEYCERLNILVQGGFVKEMHILEVLFPIEVNGIINPNMDEFLSFF